MNKHYTFQEYLEKFTSIQDSYDYYFELQKEIDRLENIIKEVRELLNQEWYSVLRKGNIIKVKEILEKSE